jgi:hypothetical protein
MDPGAHSGFRIVTAKRHNHVTDAVVQRLEEEVSAATGWKIERQFGEFLQKSARALAAAGLSFPIKRERDLFMVMMGAHCIPFNAADWLATRGRRVAWMFDAWPRDYEALQENVRKYRVDALFVTAKQSADRMARAIDTCEVKWCAEPLIDLGFKVKPWGERTTDVIQFGRKYDPYHARLLNDLSKSHITYLYEEEARKVIFPTKTEFVLGLANSKVSVCFPCDLTHPDRAGDVSTVTQRYFQSFASGCVVVGQTPPELIQLFGYDPVIRANLGDPAAQIEEILAVPEKYAPLVRQNLEEVRNHTTASRVESILRDLA